MADEIKIELTEEARATLRATAELSEAMLAGMARAMDVQNQYTVAHIQRECLSFPKDQPSTDLGLRVQTNRLRSSVRASAAAVRGQQVESGIGSNVAYAAIHEFGGTIPAHRVVPKSEGGVLRFQIGERVIFAAHVDIPSVTMPARAPFQRGIEDRAEDYGEAISEAITGAWEK